MKRFFWLISAIFLGALPALGAGVFSSQSEYSFSDFQVEPRPKSSTLPQGDFSGQVDTWSWNFGGSPPPGQTSTLQWFVLRPEYFLLRDQFEISIKPLVLLDTGAASQWHISPQVSDLYVSFLPSLRSDPSQLKISVGRKVEPWSEMDSFWSLGVFQPRLRWDYLQQETLGLFGVFGELQTLAENSDYELWWHAYGSPLLIPELSNSQAPVDGKFTAPNSRWTSSPPNQVVFSGQVLPINYQVANYSLTELLIHGGVALGTKLSHKSKTGWFSDAAYAYKPVNQIMIAYNGVLDVPSASASLTLAPYVMYHQVVSAEGGYDFENGWRVWGGGLLEYPDRPAIPAGVTYQDISKAALATLTVEKVISGERENAFKVVGSYFSRSGGNAPDQGPIASQGVTNFEDRYVFSNAVYAGVQSPLPGGEFWRKIRVKAGMIYDTTYGDNSIFSLNFRYHHLRALWLQFGADILGSNLPENDVSSSNWISRFRYNDRVYGGISVLF